MAKTFLKPINIPSEVSLSCKDKSILAKGKLGELVLNVHSDVELLIDDEKISFSPSNELPDACFNWHYEGAYKKYNRGCFSWF